MVHPAWRTTSSTSGPLSDALMIPLFIGFLPINNKTQEVESTRMQPSMLFEPPNWPQLHPMKFTLSTPKGPQGPKRAFGVFGQVPITSISIFYF